MEQHPVTPYIQNFCANDQGFSDFSLKKVVLPDPTKHPSNGVIARQVAFWPLFSEKISKFFRIRPARLKKVLISPFCRPVHTQKMQNVPPFPKELFSPYIRKIFENAQ
ncbi:MAG: hypothetical protein J5858_09435 [Lentisphaeria bacterium]|nr:hypothetical protein [Lentisphaeria bacterium]